MSRSTLSSTNDYIERILSARVYDVAVESDLDLASGLSRRLGNRVLLKREDQQPVFSFKCRGAYNTIAHLHRESELSGVVAASAGNHAQGVALAASRLGISAIVVMPQTTPKIKVDAVLALGGEVILHGDTFDEAQAKAESLEKELGLPLIHPFDDPYTIAGQGTVAVEICRQHPDPIDVLFVPVGGGGLLAGLATFLKQVRPTIRIVGVEPEDADAMYQSLEAGERVRLEHVGLFADGVAVKEVGEETFALCRQFVDEIVRVSVDEICAAMKHVFDDTRTLMEPAGALGVAGLEKYVHREGCRDLALIAITSGANVNFDRLRHVAERAEIGEQKEALLAITIPERPGSFRQLCARFGRRSVTEFNYRYSDSKQAVVFAGVQLDAGESDRQELIDSLRGNDGLVQDLTEDETAKLHVRYMVGGRPSEILDEHLYRFEFPERPGALANFLDRMASDWNISLFHYRNHGAAVGRVLVGIQVPEEDWHAFEEFLSTVGYPYVCETENSAYRGFLR